MKTKSAISKVKVFDQRMLQPLLITLCLLFSFYGYSQQSVSINNSGAPADPSAMLDVSSTSKGLLIPRVSLTSINDVSTIPNPAISLLVYNTNAAMTGGAVGFWYFNGSIWVQATGPQGPAGATGPQGLQGVQGPTGVQGLQGAQGIQGSTGPIGPTGVQGLQGVQGPTGLQGIQGVQGPTGAQGLQGVQGSTGPIGPTGVQGLQGVQGPTGLQGIQGVQGTTGAQGLQGVQGPTGQQGLQGIQGTTGAQGLQGVQGIQGSTGTIGPTGVQGLQGVPGATGHTGATGPVAGTDGQVIYNNGGVAGGAASLYYDDVNNRIGMGTTIPSALLHTNGTGTGEGNVLFTGEYKLSSPGAAPVEGTGTRMMWYPDKAAFRAGYVTDLQWDTDSIGTNSVAMGYDTKALGANTTALGASTTASGNVATALGYGTVASGSFSTAMGNQARSAGGFSTAIGYGATASGEYSTALGRSTLASGFYSTALGYFSTASGNNSYAIGDYITAYSYRETVIGSGNTAYTPISTVSWNPADRLFVIGNGPSFVAESDAMTILKNGNTGIGTSTPTAKLDVAGNGAFTGTVSGANATDNDEFITKGQLSSLTMSSLWDTSGTSIYNKNTGNVGIGTDTPVALLHTYDMDTSGGNVLFEGSCKYTNPGPAPMEGVGTRMMWYPDKAAFRAGYDGGDYWNTDNIGSFSVAMGRSTKAFGSFSVAMGNLAFATGAWSFAFGYGTTASGMRSFAGGYLSQASGHASIALGYFPVASGDFSTSFGYYSTASGFSSAAIGNYAKATGAYSATMGNFTNTPSYAEITIGSSNTIYTPLSTNTWNPGDRLFVIGNGADTNSRSNAITVLKNGNTGIGTDTPVALLHTYDMNTSGGNVLFEGSFKSTNPGSAPVEGAGTRMMWYPDKAAFRAGSVAGGSWNTSSVGDYSVAFGCNPRASGMYSAAFGYYTIASGMSSFAVGYGTNTSGDLSFAYGFSTNASGGRSFAGGYYSQASGQASIALGYQPSASGDYSTSIGNGTIASGSSSTAFGYYAKATGAHSAAIGNFTNAPSQAEIALGSCNTIYTPSGTWNANRLFVIGNGADTNSRSDAMAVLKNGNTGIGVSWPTAQFHTTGTVRFQGAGTPGSGKILTSDGSGNATWQTPGTYMPSGTTGQTLRHNGSSWIANSLLYNDGTNIGIGTTTPAALFHTYGTGTGGGNVLFVGSYKSTSPGAAPASGAGTRLMWYPDKAAFRAGVVTGNEWNTDSIGNYSVATGYNTKAKGIYSVAMGYYSLASGNNSNALGFFTKAVGESSCAFGNSSKASGNTSSAMGWAAMATGDYSTALGYNPTASGDYSSAIGWMAYASNHYATAMGYNPQAHGMYATAIGRETTATGNTSIAIGNNTAASGNYSMAMGNNTSAPSGYEMVVGRFNTTYTPASTSSWNTADRLFVIGNGTGTSATSNAMTVLKSGKTGIGTDTPQELLHIRNTVGSARFRISSADSSLSEMAFCQDLGTYKGAIGYDHTSENIYIYVGGNINFKNGRIGIQTVNNPNYAIELPNSTVIGTGKGRANEWLTYSDKRIKSDINTISYGINEVMKLKPVSYYQHNSSQTDGKLVIENTGAKNIGFIAQDIYKIIPEVVTVPNDENTDLWSMSYEKLTPVLVKAIQEQQEIIEELKIQNSSMQKQIDELKKLMGK